MNGSFADMILLPSVGSAGSKHKSGLAMLTNPGQLHLYGNGSLSLISSQPEKQTSIFVEKFSGVVPMVDPIMTVAKLVALPPGGNSSKVLHEVATARKNGATPAQVGGLKWPLTGGVPSQLAFAEHATVERVYVAGYEDGSVRLWNATYLVLSLIYILECKMQNLDIASFSAPVSNLEFCSHSLRLAVGNIHGLVRIYNLNGSSHGKNICILTETKNEGKFGDMLSRQATYFLISCNFTFSRKKFQLCDHVPTSGFGIFYQLSFQITQWDIKQKFICRKLKQIGFIM
uniref:Uncharacterized protein MANES_08G093100 n=1 Tax=Rhizophora mucronata TaxID=61149 RepID=A0A2P2M1D5_RHIMU